MFVAVRQVSGVIAKVPTSEDPSFTIVLARNERLLDATITESWVNPQRSTKDYRYTAIIATDEAD